MEAIGGAFTAAAHGVLAAAAAVGDGISSLARRGTAGARSGARRKGVPCRPQLLPLRSSICHARTECLTAQSLDTRHSRCRSFSMPVLLVSMTRTKGESACVARQSGLRQTPTELMSASVLYRCRAEQRGQSRQVGHRQRRQRARGGTLQSSPHPHLLSCLAHGQLCVTFRASCGHVWQGPVSSTSYMLLTECSGGAQLCTPRSIHNIHPLN